MKARLKHFSDYALWVLLAVPGLLLLYRYNTGVYFYGEVVHKSGLWATQLLILALAVSPLRRLFPKASWSGWILKARRYFGVASFAYAALHTGVYIARKASIERVLSEGLEAGLLTGWLALGIFLPLAITSNDFAVRRLRRYWKLLHRWVYLATALVFAHWVLTAFDRTLSIYHLALVLTLEAVRVLLHTAKTQRR